MNAEIILSAIGKIIGAIFAGFILYIMPVIKNYINEKTDKISNENIKKLIKEFVQSAEQCLKTDDPTGEKRKNYVIQAIIEEGLTVDQEINALIESAVYELNHKITEVKSGETQN